MKEYILELLKDSSVSRIEVFIDNLREQRRSSVINESDKLLVDTIYAAEELLRTKKT